MPHLEEPLPDFEADAGLDDAPINSIPSAHSRKAISFRALNLRPELLTAIEQNGFEQPSEIQVEALPHALQGEDLVCQGKAGMGKTAVFIFAVLNQLEERSPNTTQCVAFLPTRELVYQVGKEFERFSKNLPFRVEVAICHAEVPIQIQRTHLKEYPPTVVVGTPLRVHQLVRNKSVSVKEVRFFVVDEADQLVGLLDQRAAIQEVFLLTPREKQVIFLTATLPEEVKFTASRWCQRHRYTEVCVSQNQDLTLSGLLQYYIAVRQGDKLKRLVALLDVQQFRRAIVFTKNPETCMELTKKLKELNFPAIDLHEGMTTRIKQFERFRGGQDKLAQILVTTDVCARGVDFTECNFVIQHDVSADPDTYLHRVGRCGRFGTKGLCVCFVANEAEVGALRALKTRYGVTVKKYTETVLEALYNTA
eukprot:TRINITY_DN6198_c0_g1_i1.p1 TRINITY_DN6198_c0_g1~~TRINITY_DN6198_c0_g1_i1.p1  ORF type:complete len:421 (-),score=123.63 TRINITY_DN6198_c0_g1_i1:137-1399(-)